jgi:PEP-CTERM motif
MNIRSVALIAALVGMQVALMVSTAHAGRVVMPEPTSLTLLGIGAGVVAVGAWWRNRK